MHILYIFHIHIICNTHILYITYIHIIYNIRTYSIYIYIYVYIRTYVRTYIHTYLPTYLPTYVLTYVHTYIYIYIYSSYGFINQHSNHWGGTTLHYALHIPKLQPIKMQTHGEAAFNREVNYRFMGGIFKQQFKRGISEEQ